MMHTALVKKLVLVVLLMFAFAFALVPLYDVFCQITGLNGKPSLEAAQHSSANIDEQGRMVRVSFITHVNQGVPFSVKAKEYTMDVQVGEMYKTEFTAQNLVDRYKVMQAVPSVAPGIAAKYLHKVACFCFNQQPMHGLQTAQLPLLFYIDTELPPEIEELTLSYTVFDITDAVDPGATLAKSTSD
jgi:cytochrome c oxidase assembly protein subunit 11